MSSGAGGIRPRSPLTRSTGNARLFLQVLLQEVQGALPSRLGAGVVEAAALVAMEAVLRIVIDEDFAVAAALLLDGLDVAHRDRCILLAEMHHERDLRLFVGVLGDLAAVIGNRRRQPVELGRRQEGY